MSDLRLKKKLISLSKSLKTEFDHLKWWQQRLVVSFVVLIIGAAFFLSPFKHIFADIASNVVDNSTSSSATAYPTQRKTWWDGTRYWVGFWSDADNRIEFWYSTTGSSWTENTAARITMDTRDFSIDADSSNAFITYTDITAGDDTLAAKASSYPGTSFSWGATTLIADGNGAGSDYIYPTIRRDSNSVVWVANTNDGGGWNSSYKATSGANTVTSFTSVNSTSFVLFYNNMVPLANGDTLLLSDRASISDNTHFVSYKNVSGVSLTNNIINSFESNSGITNNTKSWQAIGDTTNDAGYLTYINSNGKTSFREYNDNSNNAFLKATSVKINDAANFGTMAGSGRQVVRTSTGTLYTFMNAAGTCEIFKSTDNGVSWAEQDSGNHKTCASGKPVSMAIDSSDNLHLTYYDSSAFDWKYVKFTSGSNTFGTVEAMLDFGADPAVFFVDIALDSSDIPHGVGSTGTSTTQKIVYSNRVSGSWKASVDVSTGASQSAASISLTIDKDNKPEIVYQVAGVVTGAIGSANDAASFTRQSLDATANSTAGTLGCSIAVDPSGNTWVAYVDATGTNQINLIEHLYADAWTTWQTAVTDSNTGKEPQIATIDNEVYIFYQNSVNRIAYETFSGSTWGGEISLITGTYSDARVRWAFNNYTSPFTYGIDFLYSDGTDVSWSNLYLPSKINDSGNMGAIAGSGRSLVRTSTGTLYSFISKAGTCGIWKSTDNGATWAEQDSGSHPSCTSGLMAAVAIDSTNKLHFVYNDSANIKYNTMSSDTFGTAENVPVSDTLAVLSGLDIAIDSNNIPHIAFSILNNLGVPKTNYSNRVGGTWDATATTISQTGAGSTYKSTSLTLDKDNKPEVCYLDETATTLKAAIGDANDASSFTVQNIDTSVNNSTSREGCSIAIDSSGNTWVAYIDGTTDYVTLVEHVYGAAWSTWQSSVTNSIVGSEPSLAIYGTDIYVGYSTSFSDMDIDKYVDGTTWQSNSSTFGQGTFQDVHLRWSYLNNYTNGPLDFMFSDATDIYYHNLGVWQAPINIDSTTGGGYPTISKDASSGDLYVFWIRSNVIYYSRSSSPFTSWSPPAALVSTGTNTWLSTSAVANNGYINLIWTEGSGSPYNVRFYGKALYAPPTKVAFSNAARTLTANVCNGAASVFTMELQDGSNNAQTPTQTTVVRVTSNSSDYTIYSDSNCTTVATNGDFTFTTSDSSKSVYIVDNKRSATTRTLTGTRQSGDSLTTGTQDYTVNAGNQVGLVVTMPGETFTDGSGNSGSPSARTAGVSFNITSISAIDAWNNVVTSYSGSKTITYSGPSSAPDTTAPTFTTTVSFTNGQSTTTLATTLYKAETVNIRVSDGTYSAFSSSVTVNPGNISADTNDSFITGPTNYNLNTDANYTVTLRDTWRNPVSSVSISNITFEATAASTITQPTLVTSADGKTQAAIKWSTSSSKTVDVAISTVTLVQNDGTTTDADGKLDNTLTVTVTSIGVKSAIKGGVQFKGGSKIGP